MQSVNKLFVKCQSEPAKEHIIFKTEFFKNTNHKSVLLLLCSDEHIYKINKQKIYKVSLSSLRFSVKAEQANKQTQKQMKGDEFHTQIYKFTLERDDTDANEFYNFNFQTMYWFDNLRNKLNMLDYQVNYDISKLIGKGTFASVYEAKSKFDSQMYAAKAFYKKTLFQDPKGKEQVENEIRIMRQLNHPNLINLHEVYENKAQIYLIIDLARGGSLEYALKVLNGPVPFLSAKVIFRQIVEGLIGLHEKNIMHRDLKPDNILFRDFVPLKRYGLIHMGPNIMVSDFGVSSVVQEKLNVYQYTGTPGYMAPEVFETETDPTKTYNEKCDIFSLGCILYYLLIGKPLFANKQANMEMKIDWMAVEQELNSSHSLTMLLQKMLSPSPNDRPSCKEILENKILEVEYGEDGVPLFKDFQRPKSSPPKRLIQEDPLKNKGKRGSVLMNNKAINMMPIMEEKQRDSGNHKFTKRNTNMDIQDMRSSQISVNPQSVKQARRSSAIIPGTAKRPSQQ
ncbi:unnamed protein product [Paramecium octaurelia]|uniref:non-specific serine/threonine protein kinase n=1 Tax=Paramecium octaurelia TaxID=43137 RepID=A0A8S1XWB6_PAROT|nr:unnamed protein product [Paramecium octaurelia]